LKVLVDSSVWVDFFNGYVSPERNALAELFDSPHEICTCGVVVSEVFQGLKRMPDRLRLAELFLDLTFLERLPDRRGRRGARLRPIGARPRPDHHP